MTHFEPIAAFSILFPVLKTVLQQPYQMSADHVQVEDGADCMLYYNAE